MTEDQTPEFLPHAERHHEGLCLEGEATCCLCLRPIAHADWWLLTGPKDSDALVCAACADDHRDDILEAIAKVEERWASIG